MRPLSLVVALFVLPTLAAPKTAAAPALTGPLLAPWKGPHGGVPPFDKVQVPDFKQAIEVGMADELREIDAIATSSSKPTFANTIAAMEHAGLPLDRARTLFSVWSSNLSTPEVRAIETEMSPKLAAFADHIVQNQKLFERIKAVYDRRASLTPEQQRLTWVVFNNFTRRGANLDAEQKKELSALNQELATLTTRFGQNQLGDEEQHELVIEQQADLAGLSDAQVAAAAAHAERRKKQGVWVIANTRSSMEPFLTSSGNRALREKGWRMWVSRGDNGDERDNNRLASQILLLRAKRAKLLGYPTFAHWKLSNTMAKDPAAAMDLMLSVWKPATEQFRKDVAEMQAIASKDKVNIEPWDYRYYAEKLRKEKYDLDLAEVTPYLQLEKIREAMFWMAGQLYGLRFKPVEGLPTFHRDVRTYEVLRGQNQHVGYWYFDPYSRPGKRSGAWMSAYRLQHKLGAPATAIVSNNSNFSQAAEGTAVTISWEDARTMFHEFGHALHGLMSNVTYPTLSGTNTTRDFVEFPSQFHENFFETPEVQKFLVNAKGEPLPTSLLERLDRAKRFNEGFATAETQASAIVDMKLHLAGETLLDMKSFEKETLKELGMPPQLVMRHRIPAFGHIFSSPEGYAAGYYSYLWSEVLNHDAFEAFSEAGNPYDKNVAKRLTETVMSVGNTVDPAEAFKSFRGRAPKPDAYLRSKGFPVASTLK